MVYQIFLDTDSFISCYLQVLQLFLVNLMDGLESQPLLATYPKKTKILLQKEVCIFIPMFIAAFYNSQDMEVAQMSINR